MVKNLARVITYLNSRLSAAIRFILIALLTCTLTLTWMPVTVGQISLFPRSSNKTITETPGWDLNKAYRCGKYLCSKVYFYQFSTTDPLSADLTLAWARFGDKSEAEVAEVMEDRARLVQGIFRDIFVDIISGKNIAEVDLVEDWQFWWPTRAKSLHPWTPRIEVGVEKGFMVVYVPTQPELGLAAQTIVTVTGIDAKVNGKTKAELAESWQSVIRLSLSSAFWGHELDVQQPWWRWGLGGAIAAAVLMLLSIINVILWRLSRWRRKLKGQIEQLTESLTVASEAVLADEIDAIAAPDVWETDTSPPSEAMTSEQDHSPSMPVELKIVWQQQTLIKQRKNFIQLFQRILWLTQTLILFFALGLIFYLFPQTRFLVNLFCGTTVQVVGIWIALTFVDNMLSIAIDYALNRWGKKAQEANPTSNCYILRVNTYSVTLKTTKTFQIMGL